MANLRGRFNEVDTSQPDWWRQVPTRRGIYRLHIKSGEVVQIGKALDLHERIGDHRRAAALDDITRISMGVPHGNTGEETLYQWERSQIVKHAPARNRRPGGNGRRSGA